MARMMAYDWPGNVRELAHTMEKAVILGRTEEIGVGDLPETFSQPPPADGLLFQGQVIPVRLLQRKYAAWALERLGGHRGRTTEQLGIDAKTLAKWLSDQDEQDGK
jgi:two-component system response regulator HydG